MDAKEKKQPNQKGQGIVEFLIFLPFMIMMYSVTLSISNAINASINQQKVTRAFWHYRNMNNSTVPRPRRRDDGEPSDNWSKFGMQIMGWAASLRGDSNTPIAPCFRFSLPLGESRDDECEETYEGTSSQFIRVQTVYGICGATYARVESDRIAFPKAAASEFGGIVAADHCLIRN